MHYNIKKIILFVSIVFYKVGIRDIHFAAFTKPVDWQVWKYKPVMVSGDVIIIISYIS